MEDKLLDSDVLLSDGTTISGVMRAIERLRTEPLTNSTTVKSRFDKFDVFTVINGFERLVERYRVLDELYGHAIGDLNEALAK